MHPRRSFYVRFFSFLLAFSLVISAQARPPRQTIAIAQKRALPPAQYIPARDYDAQHYKLDLRFDWEREQALGTATITFSPLTPNLQRVEFDAANMTFASVTLADGRPLRFEADAAKEKLRIALDRAYQPNEKVTVVVNYRTNGPQKQPSGIFGTFGGGLTFIKPTPEDPSRPRQIWSQGETEYNHYWFPCFDHPNDFATSELIATVEKPFTVISNGKLVERRDNPDGTRTFHWRMDQPHAPYLVSIIVGEYAPIETSYDGIPITSYVYPNEVEEGRVTFARIADMVRFFSEKTGVRYPYAKYAQTVVRDFGGGMENITATTLTDTTVHDARAELDQTSDGLISHELAHQWFGDYVTCRTWADIWLNESFATYFEAMWTEHHLGRDEFLYSEVKANQDSYYEAWNSGLRRPIVTRRYNSADELFDVYAYPRGAAVLHMLRRVLGEENWWRAINHYLTKYAHQPVETAQWRIAIEEATGQPMDWFFDQWIYQMGHPVFRVTKNYDPAKKSLTLVVRQEQKPDPNNPYPQTDYFRAPVEIEIGTERGVRVERVWLDAKEEQRFEFAADEPPLLVHFDFGGTLIKELKFDKPVGELVYQLQRDPDVIGRTWALGQLKEKLAAKTTSEAERQQIVSAISEAVTRDAFWGVRRDAVAALEGERSEVARRALLAATRDAKSRVRARAIRSLAATGDASLATLYQQALGDQSYAVIDEAAEALGKTKSPAAYGVLIRLLDQRSWRDRLRIAALRGLAELGDRRALEIGLRYAQPGNPVEVRSAALTLVGAVGKGDERAFALLSEQFNRAINARNQTLLVGATEGLLRLNDPRARKLVEEAESALSPRVKALFQRLLKELVQGAAASQ